ncbi:Stk1 family PASTA domain-containing Ser/Thr kinase [Hoyosella sp. YIM 151337]|uniref:Stk1 family PASTA domain-containing Ser/Thr kinase n=1 Tax=Hoyosella sp. YIM 151337 TaxID=2992742 RepID=UPI002235EBA5|nr:Stk1 family PASTA domain-containing Ser/Thr kinase [Hoyosella sp. YIM 151337]MCW4355403.1 Stk1 family PASTA domain-containing Ser/Thr kinase [Hoyosella sp. YIM 151337]
MSSDSLKLVGHLLDGRYRIDAPIARGGMSMVYQGMDLRLERPVAIKVMDPRFSDDVQFLDRFELEARSVAKLSHPSLVAVFDQGTDQHHVFLVMELVPGGTLRELLRERGPMPPYAAAAVARPVLRALSVAHRAGLVHRDIKPENVLISDAGAVKIADFGLVRAVAASGTTSGSMILGTAAYLSPEQVSTGAADARSDVYSMGILLFEMLTGQTPFTGDNSIAIAYQRTSADVPAPSSLIAGVPREFDELVGTATARNPAQRFADAGAMANTLMGVCERLGLPPYRVPVPQSSAQHRTRETLHGLAAARAAAAAARPENAEDGTRQLETPPDDQSVGDEPRTTVLPAQAPAPPVVGLHAGPGEYQDNTPAPHTTRALTQQYPPSPPASPESRATDDDPLDAPRGRRSPLVVLIAVLLIAALVGTAAWWLASGRYVDVPATAGLGLVAAESAIEDAGLTPVRNGLYRDTEPIDTVLGMDPAPGSRVPRGSEVTLDVSLGQPVVPEITGDVTVDEMADVLAERTFEVVVDEGVFDRDRPEGTVVSLAPSPGTVLAVGSRVTVTPSLGEPVIVPDVRGLSAEEARDVLADAGLSVAAVQEDFDGGIDAGRVAQTEPAIGAEVAANGSVSLVVSNAVRVPSVLGRSVSSARDELSGLGFGVEVRQLVNSGSSIVVGQSPSAGSRQRPGGTVTLTALP